MDSKKDKESPKHQKTPQKQREGRLKNFKTEVVSLFIAILSLIIGLVSYIRHNYDPAVVAIITFGSVNMILLLIALFVFKKYFRIRFDEMNKMINEREDKLENSDQILRDFFGFSWRRNQYFRRISHFTDEKRLLAQSFVRITFPHVINLMAKENRKMEKVFIIFDSGTTVTPIFPELINNSAHLNIEKKISFFYQQSCWYR